MEYVADEANKDNKLLQSEMQSISTELNELKKVSSVVETLAKVGNKAHWANTIKSSQSEEDQAKIFYDAYRLQLAREEDFKDEINELKDLLKEQETKIMLLNMNVSDAKKKSEKLKQKLQQQNTTSASPTGNITNATVDKIPKSQSIINEKEELV